MKKKVLILGVNGMAGHRIYEYLNSLNKYDITITARDSYYQYTVPTDIFKDLDYLKNHINILCPDIIINCIGMLIKPCEENPDKAIYVNSYFPHWLERKTKNTQTKIIHLSTDCVFDGKPKGNNSENDTPTGVGFYAKSKALGEIINNKDLTLRMSIIGDELKENGSGLFVWFMKQKGKINGYNNHYWSGITTLELAKQIDKIIDTDLTGLYHLSPGGGISKYYLLKRIQKIWNKKDVDIISYSTDMIDKTLVNHRQKEYDPKIPSYDVQLQEMKDFIERKK